MLDAFLIRDEQVDPFNNFRPFEDILFVISFLITIIATLMPIIMYLVHKFYLVSKHNEYFKYSKLLNESKNLKISKWNKNKECNNYFSDFK